MSPNPPIPEPQASPLLEDIRHLIDDARSTVAAAANMALTQLSWRIGQRINVEVLGGERAAYGDRIVSTLSRQLVERYGQGYSTKNLRHMMRFADAFPEEEIVSTLWRHLSWSHFKEIIYLKQPLQIEFYAEMARVERWSVRTLRQKIDGMLYERTALSRQPDATIEAELQNLRNGERITPELVFRDPYFLDFLGLQDRYLEKDLEDAILREMEHFLLELGAGFAFVGRQKRIQVGHEDYYLDLLFYNRYLRRLVVIDLKLGDFKPEYKGQMELYLRWLDKHERQEGEASPLGIILCAGKQQEIVELLELDRAGIHVAEYITALPPKELLREKLHSAIALSQQRLGSQEDAGSDDRH